MKKYTLFDAIFLGGERDIADNTYDFCNYFDCDMSEDANGRDAYDRVMRLFAEHIEATGGNKDYIYCNISEFIEAYRAVFDAFLNKVYSAQYKPCNNAYVSADSEEFYDLYIEAFAGLINGNFACEDYALFERLFCKHKASAKAKSAKKR